MAYEIPVQLVSFKAGVDLSEKQFSPVKLDQNGNIVPATDSTDIVVGVLQDNPAAGHMGSVMTFGITKVKAGAAISIGSLLTAHTDGTAKAATTGDKVFGIALTPASAGGEVIAALVVPGFFAI